MAFSLVGLITNVVGWFISALLLWLAAAKFFKLKDDSYWTAFYVAAIVGVVSYVLTLISISSVMATVNIIVTIVLGIVLVWKWYKLDFGKAFLVWLAWFVMGLILSFILGLIFAAVGLSLIM